MSGEAEVGTGFRLTGSILGAGGSWWDDGDLYVEEGWEGEGWNLGRPRSIMFGIRYSFQGFECGSIVLRNCRYSRSGSLDAILR